MLLGYCIIFEAIKLVNAATSVDAGFSVCRALNTSVAVFIIVNVSEMTAFWHLGLFDLELDGRGG